MRPLNPKPPPPGRWPMFTFCERVLLRRRDGADERAVVQLAVEVDVHRPRRGVVDAGDVVPGVGLQRRRAVAEHVAARAVRQLEADRARPVVDRRVELVADRCRAWRRSPRRRPGNAAELIHALIVMLPVICSAARVAEVDVVVDAVEARPRRRTCRRAHVGAVGQRAGQPVARGIGGGRAAALVERVARRRALGGGGAVFDDGHGRRRVDVVVLPAASRARAVEHVRAVRRRRRVPRDRVRATSCPRRRGSRRRAGTARRRRRRCRLRWR